MAKKLFVELADTDFTRAKGLMERKSLGKNAGMLFSFRHPTHQSFWMQKTYIPLDIAYIDDDGRILQIEEMVPLSTRGIRSRFPCRYALEVNHGWFKKNKIQIGAQIGGFGLPAAPESNIPGVMPQESQQNAPELNPDITLDRSHKQLLEDANKNGYDLIIAYQTKDGISLPPKVISPPYEFKKDEDGHMNSIVTAWDNQTGGWKSFIIDNIIDLEKKEIPEGNQKGK